jgi:hypothetical protein
MLVTLAASMVPLALVTVHTWTGVVVRVLAMDGARLCQSTEQGSAGGHGCYGRGSSRSVAWTASSVSSGST